MGSCRRPRPLATDEIPGESTKTVWQPACGETELVKVAAIVQRVQLGNMRARSHPEAVSQLLDIASVLQTRVAEQELLDGRVCRRGPQPYVGKWNPTRRQAKRLKADCAPICQHLSHLSWKRVEDAKRFHPRSMEEPLRRDRPPDSACQE